MAARRNRSPRQRAESASLADAASEQIRAVLEAAERAAAEIRAQAEQEAERIRRQALEEATGIRSQARGELGALIESIRLGLTRVRADLDVLEEKLTAGGAGAGEPEAGGGRSRPPEDARRAGAGGRGAARAGPAGGWGGAARARRGRRGQAGRRGRRSGGGRGGRRGHAGRGGRGGRRGHAGRPGHGGRRGRWGGRADRCHRGGPGKRPPGGAEHGAGGRRARGGRPLPARELLRGRSRGPAGRGLRARAGLRAVRRGERLFEELHSSPVDQLVVSGAREHNLKDITVSIPRGSLTVITGLSGSGKSSLAFDTIYAEGQRRYVESLSAYARQFLGQMDKPDVDSIEGLSPAISIDQKTTSRNPRSTVGTVTEIYDYLRLLWARVGHPHCHVCGRPISGQSAEQIIDQLMELPEATRFMVLAPIVRGRKGEYGKQLEELRGEGFSRVKVDGELRRLDEEIGLDKRFKHDIAVVVDRLVMKPELRKRLADSVETAVALADGLVEVELVDSGPPTQIQTYSERFACPVHGPSLVELEPRIFSFNSPHGACPRCTGLGSQMEIDPELVVPDPSLSIGEGAIAPWAASASDYYEQLIQAISERYAIDLDTPWGRLPAEQRRLLLYGSDGERVHVSYRNRFGRRRSYAARFEGIIPSLERRYRETDSELQRERIEEYMTLRPCPQCQGAR